MNNTSTRRIRILTATMLLCMLVVYPSKTTLKAQNMPFEGAPYSLDQCIYYALKHQKNIENATFDKYLAEKRVKEIKGNGLPQVSGSAQFQHVVKLPTSLIDITRFQLDPTQVLPPNLPDSIRFASAQFGVNYNLSLGASVTQLLFDGSFFIGLKAAREFVDLQELNIRRTEIETQVAVTKAYYSALVNEERARLLRTNLKRLDKLLATTKGLFKEGFAEKVDVDRLTIAKNNLAQENRKISRLVDLGYDLLKFQMGMPIQENIRLDDKITNSDQVPAISSLVLDPASAENRLEMSILQQSIRLQERDAQRNRVGLFGTLVAFGNYNLQTFRPRFFSIETKDKWFPNYFWGLSYNVTFFDGLQKRARIQKANLEVSKLRNQMAIFEQSVLLESRNASVGVTNAWTDVENARENQELAEEVYRISTTKYKEGVGSNLE
ncbi:MAG TPA: TolC family protein, partial [Bacteroidetes bacterium]|nr:TolC family protein [Bacteroidota bacterium]